ncbi:stretch-activated Ca2+-permeable channel component-domain-containing protein [Mycena alexandri]|uniref:Stretch-activated Ca2+-permeable channel component-domain-containing protein n=1 Tax=Mycena alexandri TaxID=1745969 RepID=A0AAD6T675_9AGAR|nr:stretch-activated Ca2+-permeable channel component-domain-containing protein [Mycena alexandri]
MFPTDRISMLPAALLLLLNAALTAAQTRQTLVLNAVVNEAAPNPPFFTIPTANVLAVSIALCTGTTDTPVPRFFVTNGSSTCKTATPQMSFQVGLSNDIPIHQVVNTSALLGDTTASQALLFSPPFSPQDVQDPTYPNYTLPNAIPSIPTPPSNPINYTVIVAPTSNGLLAMQQTACALSTQKSTGVVANESLWLRDSSGWRKEWLMTGLTAKTNYTVYIIQDTYKVSKPIFFTTKSSTFSCSLVSQLPYCPTIAYAVPLPAPPSPQVKYDSTNLPSSLVDPLTSSLTNFTTTLTTFACGRDFYSPLVTCADCQRAYRIWLCAISFSRCADPDTAPSAAALLPSQSFQRPESWVSLRGISFTQLLPCLETCTATDRACPNFLGFRCPLPRFNAAQSYGVGYVDSGADGVQGGGSTGSWSDAFGNVWCNSGW